MVSRQEVLPHGCSHNGSQFVSLSSCSQQECDTEGSVCCCRATQQSEVEGITCLRENMSHGITNVTACGCTTCDDDTEVTITLTIRVVVMRSNDSIAAAQIFRLDGAISDNNLTLLGITDNLGYFHYNHVSAAVQKVVLMVQAPNYIPQLTPAFNLEQKSTFISHTVVLMPSMEVAAGRGNSPLNLQLGNMLTITAPAGSFTNKSGDLYEGEVIFNGCVVDMMDKAQVDTIPNVPFTYTDPTTSEQVQFGVLLVYYLQFQGTSGAPLQVSN